MVITDTRLQHINDTVGVGVFATRRIPKGTIVWVQDPMDSVWELSELETMPPVLREPMERYSYMDHNEKMILCWDLGKYFNHSCNATCLGFDFPFELAVRDIEEGEELTDDYATFYSDEESPFVCQCGSPDCRGEIGQFNRAAMMPVWRRRLKAALAEVRNVPQPLAELLPPGALDDVTSRYG